ncbi:hypothetical protein [Lysobacter xanthus]
MSAFSDTADAIVDHAEAIARLDPRRLDATAFDAALAAHVHAIRVLGMPHVEPHADRAFFKALKASSMRADGVYVHIPDGIVEFLVDTARGQARFALWNAREMREGGP